MSDTLTNLLAELSAKEAEARALIDKPDATADEVNAIRDELKTLKARIEAQRELDAAPIDNKAIEGEKDMEPVNKPLPAEPKRHKGPFNTFGEQLQAIVRSSRPGAQIDPRLLEVQNAASGANESVPSEGGFLVQQDFATEIIRTAFETGKIAPLCRRMQISQNANSIKINGIDESSRANGSRWGGVQAYWADEADTVTATKPKFRKMELTLNKLMAIYYVTNELLQDASAIGNVMPEAFADEIRFVLDDAVYRADGAGKPLGILKSNALVTVAAEAGQAADTVIFENVVKMWSRLPAASRANAVWFINQEIEPQLYSMYLAVGTGGVPVYLPANGLSSAPYGTLFGRPVIPIEQASAPGDVGDIVLADMSKYLLVDKGGVETASSMHIRFEYDEMAFRVTYRVDGQPLLDKPITPYKGSAQLSPFVALAAR